MSLRALSLAVLALAVALAAGVATAAAPPAARADFAAPTVLAPGTYAAGVTAATDATGTTTAALVGVTGGPKLVDRARGAAWPAVLPPFPASNTAPCPGVAPLDCPPGGPIAGPVVAAAGGGVLAVAWRKDRPHKYSAIVVALRDHGQAALGAPVTVADDRDGGVRHPAVAVNRRGGAVLAYNTGTRATHLSMRGAVAVALRRPGGALGASRIVDPGASGAPAVAIGANGRGVVAWTRSGRVRAATIDTATGQIGAIKTISPTGAGTSVVAAAGPDGAATVAWIAHAHRGTGHERHTTYWVASARRAAGRQLTLQPAIGASRSFLRYIAVAADEGGKTTLAWSTQHFGDPPSVGVNGVTSGILTATATPGRPFDDPQTVVPRADALCSAPTIAASAGRIALAWSCLRHRTQLAFQAVVGTPGATAPSTFDAYAIGKRYLPSPPTAVATLDAHGTATILAVRPDPGPITASPTTQHIIATTGD